MISADEVERVHRIAQEHGLRISGQDTEKPWGGWFRIDDEDLEDLKTVRDAVDYVVAKLGTS